MYSSKSSSTAQLTLAAEICERFRATPRLEVGVGAPGGAPGAPAATEPGGPGFGVPLRGLLEASLLDREGEGSFFPDSLPASQISVKINLLL